MVSQKWSDEILGIHNSQPHGKTMDNDDPDDPAREFKGELAYDYMSDCELMVVVNIIQIIMLEDTICAIFLQLL